MSFEIGDILIPSVNNMERFDRPMPRYKITDFCRGKTYAENLISHEEVVINDAYDGFDEGLGYYYEKEGGKE